VISNHHVAIPGSEELSFIDVLPGASEQERDALIAIHLENFGASYPYAVADIEKTWSEGSAEADIIEHQWLLLLSGNPVGEFIFRTNMRRRIVMRQFLSVNRSARADLPKGWLPALIKEVANCADNDVARSVIKGNQPVGSHLIAMMSEVRANHVAAWRSLGHISPKIGYCEPAYGAHWVEHGEPSFAPMSPIILRQPGGDGMSLSAIATEAVSAFLLDYYRLPDSNKVVLEILDNCKKLQEIQQ
jgi:hypothetical protein